MTDTEARLSEIVCSLRRWTDADLHRLKEAINGEFARRIYGEELEAKAKAAERMYDD